MIKNIKQKRNPVDSNILILGGGSFGTAMAQILSNQHQVTIWTRNKTVAREINKNHTNTQYIPHIPLQPSIAAITTLKNIKPQFIIIALPSFAVSKAISKLSQKLPNNNHYHFLITSKGLDPDTGQILTNICHQYYPNSAVAVLAGPNYAKELASGQPSIAALSCDKITDPACYIRLFDHTNLQILTTRDLYGVQLASTYKHIAAMYSGICDALNANGTTSTYNLKAYLWHAYWQELGYLIKINYGQTQTMYLSPILGDLFISCSQQSRNYRLGFLLISNSDSQEYKKLSQVCEGPQAIKALTKAITKRHSVHFPLLTLLKDLLPQNLLDKKSHTKKISNITSRLSIKTIRNKQANTSTKFHILQALKHVLQQSLYSGSSHLVKP